MHIEIIKRLPPHKKLLELRREFTEIITNELKTQNQLCCSPMAKKKGKWNIKQQCPMI